jgi:hypothetical protein
MASLRGGAEHLRRDGRDTNSRELGLVTRES